MKILIRYSINHCHNFIGKLHFSIEHSLIQITF